jgi:uncharacterized RDD family membrane protein YckC
MPKPNFCSTWRRLGAFLFDFLIVDFLLLYPFTEISEKAFGSIDYSFMAFQGPVLQLVFAICAIYILYFLFFEWLLGQTIGKMLMKIISVSADEKRMSFWQALGRNLFIVPVIPFVFFWILDPIFIIWKRISLSEMLTKTKTTEVAQTWKAR